MIIEKNYHRVILNVDDAIDALLCGVEIDNWLIDDIAEVEKFSNAARYFDSDTAINSPEEILVSPEEYHKLNQENWLFPNKGMNLEYFLLEKCDTEVQAQRVLDELKLFKQYDLETLLEFMIYMINVFRDNNIVWGVGRGSSVSSYILYLIGVHKVDSLKYDLQIEEFLKEK